MPELAENAAAHTGDLAPMAVDGAVLKDWRRRFWLVNRERLRRVAEGLAPHQKSFLDLLPLLLHINFPLLPGYVGKMTPSGVAEYTPDKRALAAARRVARSFDYERRAAKSIDIHALFLMGSSGTVAYTRKSDFDIWVCHRPGLAPDLREELVEKTRGISRWAETLGLEVHFFVMVAEDFRDGAQTELSSESSGSAQHFLLLDEFYRTGLLIAGRFPIWWLVPPDRERNYAAYTESLTRRRFVGAQEYVDFGPVPEIPAAEFLGATLWHLTKAIRSPHKSLLKIILLEAYATEHPEIDLLSHRFKQAVQNGEMKVDRLDPYVTFGARVEEYLRQTGDATRLELARRSFYFKVNEPLGSPPAPGRDGWRREVLQRIVDDWGWDGVALRALDTRRGWKVHRVMEERKDLVNALMHSYRVLSRFARDHAASTMVSDRDMTVLGRQLFAAFEHKAGKVEMVNQGISNDLSEEALSIQSTRTRNDQDVWVLYRGAIPAGEEPGDAPLKRARSLIEVAAWCHFNGLVNKQSRVTVNPGATRLTSRDVEGILGHLRSDFPASVLESMEVTDYGRAPELVRTGIFVNLGVDPMEKYTRQGKSLTSAQSDALSFGGLRENLVHELEYLAVTSWREVLTFRFQGIEGLLACLCEHLKWVSPAGARPVPGTICHAFTPGYARTISQRMTSLFDDVTAWFRAADRAGSSKYVLQAGDRYHVLLGEDGSVRPDFSGDFQELVRYLGRPAARRATVTVDRAALAGTALPLVFGSGAAGTIRCLYQVVKGEAVLWVVDETGALFHDTYSYYSEATLINHLDDFFESVRYRQATASDPAPEGAARPVRFFRIVKGPGGVLERREVIREPASPKSAAFNVQVIGELVDGEPEFTLYCDGHEFSTLEHGDRVFEEMSRHIVSRRRGNARYPVYITDIDLSRIPAEGAPQGGLRTIQYLHYKKRIERQLNGAVASVGAA